MPDPLSAETIARMKREHASRTRSDGSVVCKSDWRHHSSGDRIKYPCSTALLLAELERVQAPAELAKTWWNGFPSHEHPGRMHGRWQDENELTGYDQGIHAGLLGPSTNEELP